MKKIISIIVIIAIVFLGVMNSYVTTAETQNANIVLNLKGATTIKEGTKTVELILSLGDFTGIEGDFVAGYEAKLKYDTNMFESIKVEELNGWTVSYEPSTGNLIGDISKIVPNTDITKITLTLKDGVQPETKGKVSLNNLVLSVEAINKDESYDFTFTKEVNITIEKQASEDTTQKENEEANKEVDKETNKTTNENTSENTNENTNRINTNSQNINNIDSTLASKKIPAAGIKNVCIIGIIILLIVGTIGLIKYRMIKLK